MMDSMSHLLLCDQVQVTLLAQSAAERLKWFGFLRPRPTQPPTLDERHEIIRALYFMKRFRRYVEPFIQDEDRVTAFEDAVVNEVIQLTRQVDHVQS